MAWGYGRYPQYVPVAERRQQAKKQLAALSKKGRTIEPVSIEGRTIAHTFWGKGWCDHLESFSDYDNRLPRGRTYVRNGSVCHLSIAPGRIEAMVMGSRMYTVKIGISQLPRSRWSAIRKRCAGQVGSMLELLQGKLSDKVMNVVTDRDAGLFPKPGQIMLDCTCPDWATMCKHVAAALYGVGSRLDERPDLLFTLRGVDPQELITADLVLPDAPRGDAGALENDQLSAIFGIDLEESPDSADEPAAPQRTGKRGGKARGKAKTSSATPAAAEPREEAKPARRTRRRVIRGSRGAASAGGSAGAKSGARAGASKAASAGRGASKVASASSGVRKIASAGSGASKAASASSSASKAASASSGASKVATASNGAKKTASTNTGARKVATASNGAKKSASTNTGARKVATASNGAKKVASATAPDQLPRIRPTGKSVTRLRRALGLSVPDLAKALGVTAATIYRWESTPGRLNLQPGSLRALAGLGER